MPGTVPPELDQLLEFVAAHAEVLSEARIAFAAMPARDGLPQVVGAVELSSPEDARKLEPQLREFIAAYYDAQSGDEGAGAEAAAAKAARTANRGATLGATTTVIASEGTPSRAARRRVRLQPQQSRAVRANGRAEAQAAAPFFVKRAGGLVVIADRQFTFRRLGGAAGEPPLTDEPGFQAARARLASDTLFLYFNTTRMSRYTKRQAEEYERQTKLAEAEEAAAIRNGGNDNRPISGRGRTAPATVRNSEAGPGVPAGSANTNSNAAAPSPEKKEEGDDESDETLAALEEFKRHEAEEEQKRKSQPGYEEEQKRQARQREFENQLGHVVFSGDPTRGAWPESVGVGASIEGDEIVLRALFVGDSEGHTPRPVPFMPILLSGPQLAPEAASVVPADADIFVAASLDLPQMYDYVASAFKIFDLAAGAAGEQDKTGLFESQVSAFERDNKLRIREDLLASLGNEIALVLPSDFLGGPRRRTPQGAGGDAANADAAKLEPQTFASSPVVIVSLSDKEAMKGLLPRALQAAGIKGASEEQLIEKRGDVEVLIFTQASAAFIGNFLVMSDPQTMRWVIDAYNRRETLAGSEGFRRAVGWQQRQLLGQVYVSNALIKDAFGDVYKSIEDIEDQELRGFLSRLDPNPGAVTHTLTKEGTGLLHELHVPKNLLALMSASTVVMEKTAILRRNEMMAVGVMYNVARLQAEYKEGAGRYGGIEELRNKEGKDEEGGDTANPFESEGYEIKVTASGDKFEATATPTDYPKQGRRSFFIDQTNVLRGADTGGRPANASTEPYNR
jgi:hypothetical protein